MDKKKHTHLGITVTYEFRDKVFEGIKKKYGVYSTASSVVRDFICRDLDLLEYLKK